MFDCIFWFKIIGTLLLLYNKKNVDIKFSACDTFLE
jgi:hypothetical protein